eukprot:CAMPEP_0172321836 /NCGR_PEP_ID=MMETSP1058-20130122/44426_1 /TAXON_ID=83371 /ORGANISM="Detonula confervacea, Strain CCMP 353" /LENGTH=699 /DNA_ID=CAMNT_0013037439 /DNA_START=83 /DNA_END=2182 /DNA_ORIENTATION=+
MTSLPHPTSADATDNYGPVTKLAQLAAAQEAEDRIEKRRIEQANLKATAALVGETALAIASAAASGSAVLRLSPKQKQAILNPSIEHSPKRMSVAARARAAADMPALTTQRRHGHSAVALPPRPTNGNAGVARGKFSKAQVTKMIDEWGRDETSEDDDDDYYYDVTSNSSADNEAHEQFKQIRAHHQLQYTMSHSPGRKGAEAPQESVAAATSAEEDAEFHYQHHRVSAYNSNKRANNNTGNRTYSQAGGNHSPGFTPPNLPDDEDYEDSGGIFASAKNWLQSQRERLHHMELERQVEDQRRKLVEEGRRQRSMDSDRKWRHGGISNAATNSTVTNNSNNHGASQPGEIASSSSFGCIEGEFSEGGEGQEEELCNIPEQGVIVTGIPNLCGFGGAYANQLDDSTTYSGVARVDSAGNILEMVPSGSFDENDEVEHMKVRMKVSSPKCTLSGNGMSVDVDLPDDDDYNLPDDVDYNDGVNNATNNNSVEEEEEDDPYFVSDVKIVPEPPQDDISTSPCILRPSQMKSLIVSGGLPPSLNFCKWKRLYSLSRDGDSFDQFLRLVEGHARTVLVVKTTRGEMFGGYADTRWEARHFRRSANGFYGSAQAFLFRFPNYGQGRREDKIVIYKWSGANRYIQLCDAAKRTVAFGGGGDEGGFGLCLSDLTTGTTGHCSTFENEALCVEGYFDVQDLEVWGFTLDF